ncbi:GEVED domain-containing protein, partial [Hymenobacter agri]
MLGTANTAQAQNTCPIAAACTPGNASSGQASGFGMGILNVTVGNNLIVNNTGNYSEGYKDYSCTKNAALTVAQPYAISVRTGPNVAENVRVWIDYNNDGAFTGTGELVFSSDNATLHTGTFTPPTTAILSTNLRMRVAADYANGIIPTSCSTPQYSQDEDYSVRLSANASPPVAAFTVSATTTCTGCVQFTDASQNAPTSWLWTFGDGTTSTLQNPNHCYTTAGTYAVTLKATNAAGNSTSAATSITYNTTVPVAASCTPQTQSYFANYGIVRFRLNTIDNTSADGSAGYQDFTCTQRTELTVGVNYPMVITTGGTNPHDIRVYLDKDNNGTLTTAEQIYASAITASPGATTTINLPATGIVFNQPLRLRVVADAIGNTTGPCVNPVSGQAEDYTVVMKANTLPPIIDFSSNYVAGSCVNPVQFTDLSTNAPTSWAWDFGDGGTSTLQNPSHQYAATGTYSVTLTATNAFGTASVTRLNAVSVQVPCVTYCSANGTGPTGPNGQTQPSPFWITSVAVATPAYTNVTGNSAGGYTSYVASPITVAPGSTMALTVGTNANVIHRTAVWVDLNQNGSFNDAGELVATGISANGPTANSFTGSFVLPSRTFSTRMRVLVQANANTTVPNPCSVNLLNAEVEDYLLRVQPLATRSEQALPSLSLYPTPTPDGRLRLALTDVRAAGLYTTEVRNLLGAV